MLNGGMRHSDHKLRLAKKVTGFLIEYSVLSREIYHLLNICIPICYKTTVVWEGVAYSLT